MITVFFVSSAIHATTGLLSTEERLQQTLYTAKSIRNKLPNSNIILLDGGHSSLTLYERKILLKEYTDVIDYSYHPKILNIQSLCQEPENKSNGLYLKGPCEAYMLWLATQNLIPEEDCRYFKISGRYGLSEEFDFEQHNIPGKYVFKSKDPGVVYYGGPVDENGKELTNWWYTDYQYKTRLYSFCGTILNEVRNNYKKIFDTILEAYSNEGFIDIEHATYKVLPPELIHEITPVGLQGIQAENGVFLTE